MVDYLKEYAEQQYSDEEFEAARRKYTHVAPSARVLSNYGASGK